MNWRLRTEVAECHHKVVLIHKLGRCLAPDDSAKETCLLHDRTLTHFEEPDNGVQVNYIAFQSSRLLCSSNLRPDSETNSRRIPDFRICRAKRHVCRGCRPAGFEPRPFRTDPGSGCRPAILKRKSGSHDSILEGKRII